MQATYKHPFIFLSPASTHEETTLKRLPWVLNEDVVYATFYTRHEQLKEAVYIDEWVNPEQLANALVKRSDLSHIPESWDRDKIRRFFSEEMTPRDYQVDGIFYLLTEKRAVVADEMGLGKTLQSSGAVVLHANANPDDTRPTLVLCPAGLRYQWRSETLKTFVVPGTDEPAYNLGDFAVVDGPPKQRKLMYRNPPPAWVICNYELLLRDEPQLIEWLGDGLRGLIVDESSRIKNPSSRTWGAVSRLAVALKPELIYPLNATPIENSLEDLWAQLHVVNPYVFPSWSDFDTTYINRITFRVCRRCGKYKPGGALERHARTCTGPGARWKPDFSKITGYNRLGEVRELIAPIFVRRTCEMVQEQLPEMVVTKWPIELSGPERREYRAVENDQTIEGLQKIGELVRRSTYMLKGETSVASSKMEALEEVMAQVGSAKVVMASESKVFVNAVAKYLRKKGYETATITSDVSGQKRDEVQRNFTHGDLQILVGTSAIERGLNLQKAEWFINLDLPWNPAKWFQRVGRIRRLGSKHAQVKVINLIAVNTVEEKILETIYEKLGLFNAVFQGDIDGEMLEGQQEVEELIASV